VEGGLKRCRRREISNTMKNMAKQEGDWKWNWRWREKNWKEKEEKRKRLQDGGQHCKENPTYVFLFWEYRGLSLNFHVHVSVRDLYISRISLHISSSRTVRPIVGIYKSLIDA
jgi:hypothetical protein